MCILLLSYCACLNTLMYKLSSDELQLGKELCSLNMHVISYLNTQFIVTICNLHHHLAVYFSPPSSLSLLYFWINLKLCFCSSSVSIPHPYNSAYIIRLL